MSKAKAVKNEQRLGVAIPLDRATPEANQHQLRWAVVRLILGVAQMLGAIVSFYLLAQFGINLWSAAAAVATTIITTVSLVLFKRGPIT
jgi:zinc transporter ZupT